MKFIFPLFLFIIISSVSVQTLGQQPGAGCEYRRSGAYRVYQLSAGDYFGVPAFHYSTNSILPIQNKSCFDWVVYGAHGTCYVYDGFDYYAGYLGEMKTLGCPLDDYIPLLALGLCIVSFGIFRIKFKPCAFTQYSTAKILHDPG